MRPTTDTEITLDPILARVIVDGGGTEVAAIGGRDFLATFTSEASRFVSRLWPEGVTVVRARFASEAHALSNRVNVGTITDVDGRVVETRPWIEGRGLPGLQARRLPDGRTLHAPSSLDLLVHQDLTRCVAQAHLAMEPLLGQRDTPVITIDQLLASTVVSWHTLRGILRPAAPTLPPIQRWIRLGEQALPAAEELIRAADLQQFPAAVSYRRAWPAHFLTRSNGDLAALDFADAAACSPLMDIAQLVTHISGWTGERAELTLGAYASVRPLAPMERRALPSFAVLDLIVEAGRLLEFGYLGRLDPTSKAAVAARAGALDMLNSLEAVLPAVARTATPVPYAKRKRIAIARREGPRKPRERR